MPPISETALFDDADSSDGEKEDSDVPIDDGEDDDDEDDLEALKRLNGTVSYKS